jgi:hypothetical protein
MIAGSAGPQRQPKRQKVSISWEFVAFAPPDSNDNSRVSVVK